MKPAQDHDEPLDANTDSKYCSAVFQGWRRASLIAGVPHIPMLLAFVFVWIIQMYGGLMWWLLMAAIYPTLLMITRNDDKAFRILWLEMVTRLTNRNKDFWHGSSYSPTSYPKRRPWRR